MTQLLKLIEGKDGSKVIPIIHKLCVEGCLKAYSYRSWNDASIFIFVSKDNSEFTMLWFQHIPDGKSGAMLQQCIGNQLKGFYKAFLDSSPQCSDLHCKGIGEIYLNITEYPVGAFLKRMFIASYIEHIEN